MSSKVSPSDSHEDFGAALSLRNLEKTYGNFVAVQDVNLEIASGEFLTFLGPSGSGKTTTLNMVAGFVGPTRGEIHMDGKDLLALPPHKRGIGMVFQNYALFPHMTVYENIAFPLKQRKQSKAAIADRVNEVIGQVSLQGFEYRLPAQLSGGQQQRVAVARSIVFKPRLVLMDEPLGALDKNLRGSLQQEIRELHQRIGITFLYVTHDQEEALALSDRIVVFNEGRIEQVASPSMLYNQPQNQFVAEFLGEANTLTGRVVEVNADHVLFQDDQGNSFVQNQSQVEALEDALLVLRPEQIQLSSSAHPTQRLENAVSGRILDVVYLGATIRVDIKSELGHVYHLRVNSKQFSQLHRDEEVTLSWATDVGTVLRA